MSGSSKPRLALIDADIYAYMAASSGEETFKWPDSEVPVATATSDLDDVLATARRSVEMAAANVKADRIVLALSCPSGDNFRKEILPSYKANRGRKPLYLVSVREYFRQKYESVERPRLEGDDVLGLLATATFRTGWHTVIVSGDKDLRQIPGDLYDPLREQSKRVTKEEGEYLHMLQTLTGDPVDNYKGCPGIGPAKASRVLNRAPEDYWSAVVQCYESRGLTEQDALVQARVAFILRSGYYNDDTGEVTLWDPP